MPTIYSGVLANATRIEGLAGYLVVLPMSPNPVTRETPFASVAD